MSIENFYTSTFTKKILKYTDNKSVYIDDTGFSGHIQQANPDVIQFFEGQFDLTHIIWCPIDTDIKEGDLINTDSQNYTVKSIQENNIGANKHLELYVEEGK